MAKICLTLLLAFLLSPYLSSKVKETDFLIKKESQLLIHGEASIINFTCHLKNAFNETPFKIKGKERGKKLHLKEGKIVVPIKNLDCGTRGMNKEMWRMLKSKKHPLIEIDFIELQIPQWKKIGRFMASDALSKIQLTIAGVKKTYPIHLNLVKMDEENFLLSGSKKIKKSDFKIKKTNYLFGLVKVKELLEIDFELFLTKH